MAAFEGKGVQKIREQLRNGNMLLPCEGEMNFVGFAEAIRHINSGGRIKPGKSARGIREMIGEAEKYIIMLVDGLGMTYVEELGGGSFLRSSCKGEMRSVFPATTAAAMTSLASCMWPAGHGFLEWFLYLEELKLSVRSLPFDERFSERPLAEYGADIRKILGVQSVLFDKNMPAACFQPEAISRSEYSKWFYGPAEGRAYKDLDDLWLQAEGLAKSGPGIICAYIPHLDAVSHEKGAASAERKAMLAALDAGLERLHEKVKGRARIIITADHGFKDVPPESRFVLDESDSIIPKLIVPPTGEARQPFFHVKRGMEAAFETEFEERFGGHFALLNTREITRLKLFGPQPLSKNALKRAGSHIAVSLDGAIIEYAYAGAKNLSLPGHHGGLSRDEIRIPLIVA